MQKGEESGPPFFRIRLCRIFPGGAPGVQAPSPLGRDTEGRAKTLKACGTSAGAMGLSAGQRVTLNLLSSPLGVAPPSTLHEKFKAQRQWLYENGVPEAALHSPDRAHSRPSSRQHLQAVNRSWYSPVSASRPSSVVLDRVPDGAVLTRPSSLRNSRCTTGGTARKLVRPGWDSRSPCSLKRGDGSPVRLSHSTLCQPRLGTRGSSTPPTPPPGCLGSLRRPLSCSRLGLPPTDVTERLVYLAQRDLVFQGARH